MFPPENFDHDTLPQTTCNPQLAPGALPCDAYHHFYHYQSSAQYLWLAETLKTLGKPDEAVKAYERAIFQDHFNEEALEGKKLATSADWPKMPTYNKHPFFDLEFCGLIGEPPSDATRPHDEGASALLNHETDKAMLQLNGAIYAMPTHSNSYFTRGKCYFFIKDFKSAQADFSEAIRLSHLRHDAYHRSASAEHLARGREFLKLDQLELAINDFTKALDLHRGNKEALADRAKTYRMKGNERRAEEDEAKLNG